MHDSSENLDNNALTSEERIPEERKNIDNLSGVCAKTHYLLIQLTIFDPDPATIMSKHTASG